MQKLKNIFHYLKSQDQISSDSFEDFQSRMADPTKLEKVYGYLKDEGMVESEDFDAFRNNIGVTDPKNENPAGFKTRAEHDAYHTQQLLDKSKVESPELYQKYMELQKAKNPDTTAIIMAMGGIPEFVPPATNPDTTNTPPANPTDWKNLDSGKASNKPAGYRYDAGHGKPAKESITKRKK